MKREKIKSNRHQNLKRQIRAFCPYPNHFCDGQPVPDKDGEKRPRKNHANITSFREHSKAGAGIRKGGVDMRYSDPFIMRVPPGQDREPGPVYTRKMTPEEWEKYGEIKGDLTRWTESLRYMRRKGR